jgi:hypothetical protein
LIHAIARRPLQSDFVARLRGIALFDRDVFFEKPFTCPET